MNYRPFKPCKEIRLIIAGSRDFNDYYKLKYYCDLLLYHNKDSIITIISGTAKGADRLGELYAKERKYKCERYPADWDNHGKRAGYLRNTTMAEISTHLIAFWNGSPGTRHMIDISKKYKLDSRIVEV